MLSGRPAGALQVGIVMPVAAGFAACVLQAFGIRPGLSGSHLSLAAWTALLQTPGLATSVWLTLRIGVVATAVSLGSALLIGLCGRRWIGRGLAPLLAVPHAALAVGLGFLIAPTGLLARLLHLAPLSASTVGDSGGWAVILALWVKETPFLMVCVMAALGQADAARTRLIAATLGYAPLRADILALLPRLWPQLRLPVLAVLAFSLSVTDVALVLGPQTPPTLSVRILRWSLDPDLARWGQAAAAALMLMGMVLAAFAALAGLERGCRVLARHEASSGRRGALPRTGMGDALAVVLLLLGGGSVMALVLWAGASFWRFPSVLPDGWSAEAAVARMAGSADAALTTLWLGGAATMLALLSATVILRAGRGWRLAWLPLLLPQGAFLFGVQILLVAAHLDGTALALVWTHLLFVLPYVLLALQGPWRALDPRYARAAASLGASKLRVLVRVSLPLLARPLAIAGAVGFAVSVGSYLPTVFAGAGRVATLATQAVSLASGADRRLLAAAALAQAALPALVFAAALAGRARR